MSKVVIGQDKDYKNKLTKPVVERVIEKFEEIQEEYEEQGKEIVGFELNGGPGMTKGAQEVWDEFKEEKFEEDKFAVYNTSEDLNRIKSELENRASSKNRNNNS